MKLKKQVLSFSASEVYISAVLRASKNNPHNQLIARTPGRTINNKWHQ